MPSKLRSKGSLRVSSGWGPRSRAEADVWIMVRLAWRPWLGNRGPWAWARSQSLPLPPAPGDAQGGARGEAAAPERVKRARVCAGPETPPPRPPTPACTPPRFGRHLRTAHRVSWSRAKLAGRSLRVRGACLGEGQRFLPLPLGKRKLAPNRLPAWASGISSPGRRPLEQFSLSFPSVSTRDVCVG